ncbi:methionyl-tRNA formyltransferase [Cypionkella aquatica]|uniref:Methionyl-tRNA formyltransferase n=1 Tax=Cypionkella aquatica TaxID=1756042 RepID=A0AA37X050_9RHOB|nr:methionyl-tRNA formyltransferase [Cypionkella aquatica]GLS85340.1 methionyl-tRNA formyltransferase [Cypionkella aquatica]
MKIIFMGTPDFSVSVLRALTQHHEIVSVYCQPPRPAGRGKVDRKSPVQLCAEALDLPVHHPVSLRSTDAQQAFAAHRADLAVVVAYGLILPQAVLDMPRLGCLNIHASLLPRWRGAAPIQRAIMAGDAETGICIMQMEAGLDTGPVLARSATKIGAEETTGELHDRLSAIGSALICETIAKLPLAATPQAEQGVSYAAKIDKAEARVDWSQAAHEVDRKIRGLSPFPGAWCEINGERIKLLKSRVTTASGLPGQVLGGLHIACGQGAVEIVAAQREGKRAMLASEVLNGLKLPEFLV